MNIVQGASYVEPGANCVDNRDATCSVVVSGTVNTAVVGSYTITYRATDAAGNVSTANRTVNVTLAPDTIAPVITLIGGASITLTVGETYTELGASCTDNRDPSCTVTTSGTVNAAIPGTYTRTYTARDTAGNAAIPVTRTVIVVAAPVVIPPDPTPAPLVCPPGLAPNGNGGCF